MYLFELAIDYLNIQIYIFNTFFVRFSEIGVYFVILIGRCFQQFIIKMTLFLVICLSVCSLFYKYIVKLPISKMLNLFWGICFCFSQFILTIGKRMQVLQKPEQTVFICKHSFDVHKQIFIISNIQMNINILTKNNILAILLVKLLAVENFVQ